MPIGRLQKRRPTIAAAAAAAALLLPPRVVSLPPNPSLVPSFKNPAPSFAPLGRRGARLRAAGDRPGAGLADQTTVYNGVYGPWTVEDSDVREGNAAGDAVRQSLDLFYAAGAAGLGLSLVLIHIYVTPIKRFLQALWAAGVLGSVGTYLAAARPLDEGLVQYVLEHPAALWFVGPTFAALTGLVFKEGLCYGKLEAGILTFVIPGLLLGHLSGLMDNSTESGLLGVWMVLFTIFAARKFQQPIKDDIGDKSVFMFNALPEEEKNALIQKLERQTQQKFE
ncbi:hypothetical protein PVAP13_9NG010200 [Panicum virgatum]|uniref:Uncharacterized protein n=1 Tax=Panicum virgatum TaxID=38727 RepID=A0A8T0MCX6_PANVG|nr:hypothetical protein PVAP13_9NG010200 [Panicum virgatum]